MTAPTIPPQQPEPERVCGNCESYRQSNWSDRYGECLVSDELPPCFKALRMDIDEVRDTHTCVLFRARKES